MNYNKLPNNNNNVSINGRVPLPSIINTQPLLNQHLLANVNKNPLKPIKMKSMKHILKTKIYLNLQGYIFLINH